MAAAAGVAFGGDQHVLAERRQVMSAERTAIRRGLAIRRAAHRPPWGGRKSRGHRSILAPNTRIAQAASLARSLVVVGVGIGVGLALAKAERERRLAAARPAPRRRPSLLPGEPPAAGLRRVMLEQLDLAIELIEGHPGGTGGREAGERTVHETRKAIKRLRALVRLLRGELGPKRFARENTALRDCGHRLAGARDAEVMLATLDGLVQRHPKELANSRGVRRLRSELLAEREQVAGGAVDDFHQPEVVQHRVVAGELRAIRARVASWELRKRRQPAKLLSPGLERLYHQGRRGLRRAERIPVGKRGDVEAMHIWRKRVKDLRYVAETLDRGGKSTKRMRKVARRADRVGEMLGEEHDLALFARVIRERPKHFAGERRTRKALLKLIARRRKRLRRQALREGERLYRRKPRRFVRRLRKAM
jgi:CHAD domain-containing protein